MTRRISRLGLAAAMSALLAGTAFAGPLEMSLTSGSQSTGNMSVTDGSSYTNSDFNGWDISYFTPMSNAPSTDPWGLNLSGFVASCVSVSGCSSLTVSLSGTGFTTPVGVDGFGTGLTNNNTMGPSAATGTIMQSAYYDSSDSYFGTGGAIGTLNLNGFGSTFTYGGGPTSGTYSLTLVDTFSASCTSSNCAIFGIDSSIGGAPASTDVPEPGTLGLFAAGLLGCGLLIARRRSRQS